MNLYDGNGCQFLPFAKELRQVAEILETRGVSAELINMTLAARAGLLVAPIDPKSPIFVWVGEQAEAPAPEAQPRTLDGRREAVLQAIEGMGVADIIDVLSLPLNTALAKTGMVATISVRNTFSYKE